MAIAKRIFLFLLTNILVIATISIVVSLLGLDHYLTANGLNYQSLAVFCAIWGMGGAFISLLLSKFMAKRAMGLEMIDPQKANAQQKFVLDMVYKLARKVGIQKMPEVGIYDSPELNAFATGATKNGALVAVSTGLLNSMSQGEVEGVLGHEISHVANGDMVTMTLIQGVVNAFALFFSRIIAYAVSLAFSRGENEGPSMGVFYIVSFLCDILLTLLGTIVVAAFSRWREYRADAGGARLTGRENMVGALRQLQKHFDQPEDNRAPALAALKISHKSGLLSLFASHPPLEKRIERLQRGQF